MHIKVSIPKQREKTYGSTSELMKSIWKKLTVPIEEIALETYDQEEKYSRKVEGNGYIDDYRTVNYYFIYLRNRLSTEKDTSPFKKYEIHEEEYKRISNILEKLNLVEIEEHNEKAIYDKLPEKVIRDGDINGLLGLEV